MSECLCKKGSVLGKLAMSAKTVSKPSLMHLTTNNRAILTELVCVLQLLVFIVPSFSHGNYRPLCLLTGSVESVTLLLCAKSDKVINEDLRLSLSALLLQGYI